MSKILKLFLFFFLCICLNLACFENFTTSSLENQISAKIKELLLSKEEIPKK